VVIGCRRSKEGSKHDLKCGLLEPYEDFDSAVRAGHLTLGTRTVSRHFFNESAGVLLEHWTKLSDVLRIKVRVHILPAAYMVCPIAHHQAGFAQNWR
jgi:hypothetical protein